MIVTYGTIKAKQAVKDSSRILGYPFAMGDRITKAMPAAVMGKDVPLTGIFDPAHKRYGEAGEFRSLYESDNDVKQVVDTAIGLEGLKRQWGVHAAGVIMSSAPLRDVIPLMKRPQDGAVITQFDYPTCETARPDQDGLPGPAQPHGPRRRAPQHRGQPGREARPRGPGARRRRRLQAARHRQHPRHLPARRRPDAQPAAADATRQLRRHLRGPRALPPRADGRGQPHQLRPAQERQAGDHADPPRARRAARGDPRADVRPDRLPGADPGHRPEARGLHARSGRPAPQGDGQEEEGDPRRRVRPLLRGHADQRLLRAGGQGAVGRARPLLRLRLQQGAHRGLRADLLLDRLPQGPLQVRVHGRAPHVRQGRQGQDGDLPQRVPPDEDPGASSRRQRVRVDLHPGRQRHPVRADRHPQRRLQRRLRHRGRARGEGALRRLQRLHGEGARRSSATSG